ncbi:phosphoenolpyruvate carboxylase [Halovenus sp. WSH3]|uniref:phosphoenolpyruvate carboxylase n=1 Tax=Halovenus carboxidivorans TaxID=2692199 RepID=A0A6B0T524_9EURY|nr:phosphoenolpyruvate carboxylase [Halovenus carboxidivorans]MXR50321.1 phosphoenolpyruvate carboxylase [Halovenus carboxidivorans]
MTRSQLHQRTLGEDIREFGDLLGEIIREHGSPEIFETVEQLRTGSIAYRAGERDSRAGLKATLSELDTHQQRTLARAFTTYFELTNLAEERERVRVLRTDSQEGTLEDSLETAAADLAEVDPETAQQVLEDVLIQPTFTAHPTEARRKTIKAKLRSIATDLETLDERLLTDKERSQIQRDIEAEVLGLWQTEQVRDRRPEPEDEARNVQWYLVNTIFDVVPEVYDELELALEGAIEADIDVPKLLEFRSWAGSDRDGNPYVTPEVTETTLDRQREIVIERYRERLAEMSSVLSQDGDRIDAGEEITGSIAAVDDAIPEARREANKRYPDEPYRQKVMVMREKLNRVGDIRPGGYADAEEFYDDLATIAESLRENGCESIADAHVEKLMRQVETFGLTLASLDLRDHQQNHTTAVAEALSREGIPYADLDEGERVETLTEAILQETPVIELDEREDLSETAARVLERFERLADWQREYGQQAIDTYCISMTDEPSHVLEVLFLADQAGVVDLPDHSGLDIVPLLETERALSGARRIMGTLFENEAYEQALAARGNTQEIMLGYSDSNKENGFLAANWSLYENQRRLAEITDDFDVTLRLFHGRGGSISRGGGPMNDALKALPSSTITGDVKFTEQGEAISEKYGNPRIGERELEQMLNAQLSARKAAIENPTDDLEPEWVDAMETMADAAREEYRSLLNTDGFVTYFGQATPIDVIEDLNLGSRPASRSGDRSVEDLRAIPWVFSWTQSRCILPGWYSLATGIDAYLDDGGEIDTLREMYDSWPFFRTTLDNAAQALGRTDLDIAREYAALADDDLRERFFPRLAAEYERAVDLVTEITRRDEPIDREWLRESLDRRNPYVDPLNLLQTHLLDREGRSTLEEQTLRITVKGIAAGMKNTG